MQFCFRLCEIVLFEMVALFRKARLRNALLRKSWREVSTGSLHPSRDGMFLMRSTLERYSLQLGLAVRYRTFHERALPSRAANRRFTKA